MITRRRAREAAATETDVTATTTDAPAGKKKLNRHELEQFVGQQPHDRIPPALYEGDLKASSRQAYAAMIIRMCKLCKVSDPIEITEAAFFSMMDAVAGHRSLSVLEGYRSALLRIHDAQQPPITWLRTAIATRLTKALATKALSGHESKGGITRIKLAQLHRALPKELKLGVLLAWAALLRHGELCRLRRDQLCIAGDDLQITLYDTKGDKQYIQRKEHHITIADGARKYTKNGPSKGRIDMSIPAHMLIFPLWDRNAANAAIAAAAKALKWSSNFRWSFHSLRHGAAEQMKLDGVPLADRMRIGRWTSANTCEHYASCTEDPRPDAPWD